MDFSLIFHVFSRIPPRRRFLEGPSADLYSKVQFGSHFGISGVPKINPFHLFELKESLKTMRQIYRDQPGAQGPPCNGDLRPKTVQNQVFIDFSMILDGFWTDFEWMFHDLERFPNFILHIFTCIWASIPNRLVGIREA